MTNHQFDDGIVLRGLRMPVTPFHGDLYVPPARSSGGVVVIGGSDGTGPWPVAWGLAKAGIPAMSLTYFKAPGLGAELRDISLEYFEAAVGWLVHELSITGRRVVLVGASRGSEAALLTAVHFPNTIGGVVASVPGNVVLGSWPPGAPAWLLDGKPLPYVDRFGPACEVPDALIPVERIPAPLLLVSGGRDEVWPSAAMANVISERLDRYNHPHGHRILNYPDAGHGVGGLLPGRQRGDTPSADADRAARTEVWPKVVAFIRDATSAA